MRLSAWSVQQNLYQSLECARSGLIPSYLI